MKHRLVCIGDSLTQGFKSGAVFEPNLSYPVIIAREMGIAEEDFRYAPFSGEGGLPFNIEYLLRRLDRKFGADVDLFEIPLAGFYLRKWMDDVEDYWERGPGSRPLGYAGYYHNLAVWGFEIQDAYNVTAEMCQIASEKKSDHWFRQIPEQAMLRTARRVLNPSHSAQKIDQNATQISRAAQLAENGGIENLIVFLGANNVLGTVTSLNIVESTQKDLDEPNPNHRKANFYTPEHFEQVLHTLAGRVEAMAGNQGKVARVFWGTVPPVTVPPISRGVGGRMTSNEGQASPYGDNDDPQWFRRYFKYYTRPWITDKNFAPNEDPHLTGLEAMKIDRAILRYKEILTRIVNDHNQKRVAAGQKQDWFMVDLHWALERLAFRRYAEDPSVPPPPDWSPYQLPAAIEALKLDTRFLMAEQGKRISGGIFSLDGIHPTTVGYGIVAQECINKMQEAGVHFFRGVQKTPRTGPIAVDFERLIKLDSLLKALPRTLDDIWNRISDGDQFLDLFKRAFRGLK